MSAINDYTTYIEGMQKSLEDKLFWKNAYIMIPEDYDTIVDFGCANGALLHKFLNDKDYAGQTLIGIDNNKEMRKLAKEKIPSLITLPELSDIDLWGHKALLNLSSVIHEVYSYGTLESIINFWDKVLNTGFHYIAIRDLMVDHSIIRQLSDTPEYCDCLKKFDQKQWQDFLKHRDHNSTPTPKDVVHYLMKYRYIENWDREVKENYFPIYYEDLINTIVGSGKYDLIYSKRYILPYVKDKIKEDFDLDLVDDTHCQLIFKMKNH